MKTLKEEQKIDTLIKELLEKYTEDEIRQKITMSILRVQNEKNLK